MYVERVEHLANNEFKELLFLAEKESYFIFDWNYFKEIDIATIGTTLGLTLTFFFSFLILTSIYCQIPSQIFTLITTGDVLIKSISLPS